MTHPDFTKVGVVELENYMLPHFHNFILANSVTRDRYGIPMVQQDSHVGEPLVICGAGPSLRDHLEYVEDAWAKRDDIWACNSAMPWLLDKGHVTHGFCVDQTEFALQEWAHLPNVKYLLASTVHPALSGALARKGHRKRWTRLLPRLLRPRRPEVQFFHNYVGTEDPENWPAERAEIFRDIESETGELWTRPWKGVFLEKRYEDFLYENLYPPSIRVGGGLNSVNRALCLAMGCGYDPITVLGADCALASDGTFHADGAGHTVAGATAKLLQGEIDGRLWVTKADMIISAIALVFMVRREKGRIRLVGDTLPNALMDKSKDFFDSLPRLRDSEYEYVERN